MKMTLLSIVVSLFAMQAHAKQFYFGGYLQNAHDMAPEDFEKSANSAKGLGLLAGMPFSEKTSLELNVDQFKFADVNMEHSAVSAAVAYRPVTGFVSPYFRGGLGLAQNKFDNSALDTKSGLGAHIGAGVEMNFKHLTAFAGLKLHHLGDVTSDIKNAQSGNALIGVIFPAVQTTEASETHSAPAVTAAPAKTEVVAAAAAKVDTDGDGVADEDDKCPGTAKGTKVNSYGCAATEKATIKINVEFEPGKTVVRPAYDTEISKLAEFMKSHPETSVEIAGHTDSTGNAKANVSLSQKRADAVKQVLVDKFSIAKERLKSVGYGSAKPVVDDSTVEGKKANRRVEATISGK